MPVIKLFYDENYEKAIVIYATIDKNICFRFSENKNVEFVIDLDLETTEELIENLKILISSFKTEENE